MADQDIAETLHEQAMALQDEGEEAQALALYARALELDYARPVTHYNIGLIHKYQRRWVESQEANRLAVEFEPEDEASNWNLAIAATANHDWRTAREVWQRLGLAIEPGDTPIEQDFGQTPVRLNPDGDAEVVWARRIDPVRARLLNIPYADSGFRYGDIVLNDGAPVGEREVEGRVYSVFNVLELFQPSPNSTFEAELRVSGTQDVDALLQQLEAAGIAAEDWSRSVRTLCRQCSEGLPHEHHEQHDVVLDDRQPIRLIAIAGPDEQAIRQALHAWSDAQRQLTRLDCVLAAGKPH
ncbi:tetratricopeptide repeat protein [Pseudomonas sp. PDM14]|uniref:tetratricopeptide repeat protein n=1 Tax=Pseudomonas sp. PDM14 TaxID=2769288 RepID=UPI0017822EAF|nr:tetratricopeptide repeat protein [Pseudomonas sp. PDM14]MBD9483462.1 tetratricopeptide repeat protein [Pseudomonas sp. PDM14]